MKMKSHQQVGDLEKRVEEMNKTLKKVQLEKAALKSSSQVAFNHGRAYDEVADRQKK